MGSKGSFALAALVLTLVSPPGGSQTVTPIEFPGAQHTRPHGINSSGEISGIYVNPDNSVHSFLLDRKGFTTIDVPGAIGTNALRINPQGEIVGFYVPSSGTDEAFCGGEALLRHRPSRDRPELQQRDQCPRRCGGSIQRHARHPTARLSHERDIFVAIDVPGAVRSTAFDINERGDIVGAYVGADGTTRLYLLFEGVFTTIDVPGAKERLEPARQARLPGSMRRVKLSAPIED